MRLLSLLYILGIFSTLVSGAAVTRRATNTVNVCSTCTYKTISSALAALPSDSTTWTVAVAAGTYNERITISRSNTILQPLVPVGAGAENTVFIEYSAGHDTQSTSGSDVDSSVVIITGTNVKLYHITIANTFPQTRNYANLALTIEAAEASFYYVKLYGFQDTLLINRGGTSYFKHCYVEGSVDFIWGYGIGYFDSCTIASNAAASITAHNRDSSSAAGGFYFDYCSIIATIPSGPLASTANTSLSFSSTSQFASSCYLGRPWNQYARVVYMNSALGSHIKPAGWSIWSTSSPNTDGVTFAEYANTGAGKWNSARASFATNLTSAQAVQYGFFEIFPGATWIDTTQ
ncbi:pectin lyase fold/virulence factor [Umbelopsis sp. PMI_123]|nr:pectin lyase fold/virulence factor [Umbelopsis sp. PMI_123]